jgi:hypothetical protein
VVSYFQGRTQIEDVSEQSPKENIWAKKKER